MILSKKLKHFPNVKSLSLEALALATMADLSPSVTTLVIEVLVSHAGLDDVVGSSATIDDLATPDCQHRVHHLDNNMDVHEECGSKADATDAAEDDDKSHIDLGILVVKLLKVRLMP